METFRKGNPGYATFADKLDEKGEVQPQLAKPEAHCAPLSPLSSVLLAFWKP